MHQQINTDNLGTKSSLPIKHVYEHNNFTCQKLNFPENYDYCEPVGEYGNNWLNDTYVPQETNFRNNQENENKYQNTCDINDSSFNNELQTGHRIVYANEDNYMSNHLCQNYDHNDTSAKEIQNKELLNSEIHLNEENIYCHDGMSKELNNIEQKILSSSNEITFDGNSECNKLPENIGVEMHTNEPDSKVIIYIICFKKLF